MSSLTTTTINTKDGSTNLTVGTANVSGPRIVVGSANSVWIGNSTSNSFIMSGTGINVPVDLSVNGVVTISNTLSMSGSLTVNSTGSFTNVTASGTVSGSRLSAANATLTTNTFTLGTSNASSNGFSRLPNGLLYQWGTVSATSSAGSITFPTSFSTVYSFVATSNTAGSTYSVSATSISTTAASVRTANSTSSTVYWMAIGV